jgi:hypothetical protein
MTSMETSSGISKQHTLDKDKAVAHCDTIVANEKLYDGDTIEFGGWSKCGKYASWYIHGWEYVGCCRFEEIDITE